MSVFNSLLKGIGNVANVVETGANSFAAFKNAKNAASGGNLNTAIEAAAQEPALANVPIGNINEIADRIERAVAATRAPAAPVVVAPQPVQTGGVDPSIILIGGAALIALWLFNRKKR